MNKKLPTIRTKNGIEFAKKEDVKVSPEIAMEMSGLIPNIYFWIEEVNNIPSLMTAAVRWNGMNFGLSFPVDENKVKARMDSKKLLNHMKEVVSVLVLHGKKALDEYNQLSPRLINEQEVIRWKFDPVWDKRVKAVDKLIRIKDITRKEAIKLKLLDK